METGFTGFKKIRLIVKTKEKPLQNTLLDTYRLCLHPAALIDFECLPDIIGISRTASFFRTKDSLWY